MFGREIDPRDAIQTLIFGGAAGSGIVLAHELIARQPVMVIDTFRQWGPLSLLGLVGLVMVDRGFRSIVGATERSALAQQKLADAVNEIAKRDNAEGVEQRALMTHVATQTEKILQRFESLELQIGKRKSASAEHDT